MRKKRVSVLFVVILLFCFTACSPKRDDAQAQGQLEEAMNKEFFTEDKLDLTANFYMTQKQLMAELNMEMNLELQLDKGDKEKKPEMRAVLDLEVSGQSNKKESQNMQMDIYVKDDDTYISYLGEKAKVSGGLEGVFKERKEAKEQAPFTFENSGVSSVTYIGTENKEDIGYQVQFDLENEDGWLKPLEKAIEDAYRKQVNSDEITVQIEEATANITADKDNNIKAIEFDMKLKQDLSGTTMSGEVQFSLTLNNKGDSVVVTAPSNLDSYRNSNNSRGIAGLL